VFTFDPPSLLSLARRMLRSRFFSAVICAQGTCGLVASSTLCGCLQAEASAGRPVPGTGSCRQPAFLPHAARCTAGACTPPSGTGSCRQPPFLHHAARCIILHHPWRMHATSRHRQLPPPTSCRHPPFPTAPPGGPRTRCSQWWRRGLHRGRGGAATGWQRGPTLGQRNALHGW